MEIVDERANFNINPNPLCKGVSVNFSATGSIDTNIVRYDWDFGDGNFNTIRPGRSIPVFPYQDYTIHG